MDFTINLRKKVKDKPKNLKRTEGNSINQREVTIEEKFCNKLSQPYNSFKGHVKARWNEISLK